jgi:23S rRNA pseudouridine2605 synthase
MPARKPRTTPPPERQGERLQRVLARAGYGSRRVAEELIAGGRVRVDGEVAELGRRVDPGRDRITVDGAPVPADPGLRYFAFNKPRGVTSTLRDPHAAESLAAYLPSGPRVYPVGRLDRESEGLLLLTNDGELAHRLLHPSFGVEKDYLVEVAGEISRDAVRVLTTGIELEDGVARALRVNDVRRAHGRSSLTMVMGEGRKREVRRMLAAVGFPVRRLVRTRQGPVRLGRLRPGESRALDRREVGELYREVGLDRAAVRAVVHHRRR